MLHRMRGQKRWVNGPPSKHYFDAYKNKYLTAWWKHYTGDFRKETDEVRMQEVQRRLGGAEYLPVTNKSYGTLDKDVRDQDDTMRLPFLRNRKIGSFYDVVSIAGEPMGRETAPQKMPQLINQGRPYARRISAARGPSVKSSMFMGTFLNSFVALDVDEWDIEALLDDIEAPSPFKVIRHLTELLDQRHMNPRRLTDHEVSRILLRCTTADEATNTFTYALENEHEMGNLTLASYGKVAGRLSTPSLAVDGLHKLLAANPSTVLSIDGLNPILSAHKSPASAEAGEKLFASICDGKYNMMPNVITYNAAMRLLTIKGDHQKVLATWSEMMDDGVNPNTYTLNCILKASGELQGFDLAASLVDTLCCSIARIGDAEDTSLPSVSPNTETWKVMLALLEGVDSDNEGYHSRVLWLFNLMSQLTPHHGLSPWTSPSLEAICKKLHTNYSHLPQHVFTTASPQAADQFLSATATLHAIDQSPVYLLLAEGAYAEAEKLSFNNLPNIFTSILSVLTDAGREEAAEAIYNVLVATPFARDVHHQIIRGGK